MKFNRPKNVATLPNTINHAGSEAFAASPKLELASLMLTATLADGFYRTGDQTATRVKALIAQNSDKRFCRQGGAVCAQGGWPAERHAPCCG